MRIPHLPLLIVFAAIFYFFLPVIFQSKLAVPADTITAMYHPLRDTIAKDYPNGNPVKNFVITDPVRQQIPYRQFALDEIKHGRLPWWNPYNMAGSPFLANFQNAVFYPLNLIFFLTDFPTGWNLLVISQLCLFALFSYLFLRQLKLTPPAAAIGSLTVTFSGFSLAWLQWNTAVHVALWTPAILYLFNRLLAKFHIKWVILLFFALIAQAFAGYPQPWVYVSLLQLAYLLASLVVKRKILNKPKIAGIGLAYLLFAVTISPLLLSTIQLSKYSNRINDQGDLTKKIDWFIPYPNLAMLVAPDILGSPAALNYFGVFNYIEFQSFIGVIPMVLVLMGLKRPMHKTAKFFLAFLLFALILSLKTPISILQMKLNLPLIGSSQPSRWIIVVDFCLGILAAFGAQNFLAKKAKPMIPLLLMTCVFGFIWAVVLYLKQTGASQLQANMNISLRNLIIPTGELILAAVFFLGQKKFPKILTTKITIIGLLIITAGVHLYLARKLTSFSDRRFLYPESQILTYLQQHQGLYRYSTTDSRIMAPNFNLPYRLYTVEGYDPLYLAQFGRLISAVNNNDKLPPASYPFNRTIRTDRFDSRVLDLLGVKYFLSLGSLTKPNLKLVMTEGETYLYENTATFPRAFTIESLDQFIPVTYLPAEITDYQPQSVVINLPAGHYRYLVLTDNYFPGWQVTIDGKITQIINWQGLRATIIPDGSHQVQYNYRHTYF